VCTYKGLFFILSGVGTMGEDHDEYIRNKLTQDSSTWRICSWHKNQNLMQVGYARDEVGWGPYEECRLGGAIIATGDHSYARSHLMANFRGQIISSTSVTLQIDRGKTIVFVSGLGGRPNIRRQNPKLIHNNWWAAVYPKGDDEANHGALFCVFNFKGSENEAFCYFQNLKGEIRDEFRLISKLN
jgi:hypothetical protein